MISMASGTEEIGQMPEMAILRCDGGIAVAMNGCSDEHDAGMR